MSLLKALKQYRAYVIGVVVLFVGLVGGLIALVRWLDAPPPQVKKTVQEIRIVRPPPPPPDIEEPPPPPEVEEAVDIPEPEAMPDPSPMDEPPPGDLLGLDADGAAGVDGFGLVSRRGGRDLLASGGSQFRWYAGVLKQSLVAHLADYERIRSRRYSIMVSLWLRPDGSIRDVTLDGTTGDMELDAELRDALQDLNTVAQVPPQNLPQPVQLQIVSRL